MNDLPKGWALASLEEVAKWGSGGTPSRRDPLAYGGQIPWIKTGELGPRYITQTEESITEHGLDTSSAKIFPSGSIAVAMYGATIGKTSILGIDASTNQACAVGTPIPGITTSPYLYHFLASQKQALIEVGKGGAQPNISQGVIKSWPIPLAPLPEQKRIADKLDAVLARVDACRARLDRVPALLKRFRQSVLAAATSGNLTEDWRADQTARLQAEFGNVARDSAQLRYEVTANPESAALHPGYGTRMSAKDEVMRRLDERRQLTPSTRKFKEPVEPDMTQWKADIPDVWSVESISAYAECLDYLRVPVTKSKRASTQGLYPYYGANGQVDLVDEYLFDDELVLVTEDETFYGREKPIAYRTSGRCWVNNHAHVLLAGNKSRADYLCFALMYYDVLPWLTGTTGRAKLTQGVLNALPIAVPPQVEIEEIVRRVESLFSYADRLEARYKTARAQVEKLTPALLTKAFRGELVPQDPNDEPAAALLARIHAGRGDQTANKPKRGRKGITV